MHRTLLSLRKLHTQQDQINSYSLFSKAVGSKNEKIIILHTLIMQQSLESKTRFLLLFAVSPSHHVFLLLPAIDIEITRARYGRLNE